MVVQTEAYFGIHQPWNCHGELEMASVAIAWVKRHVAAHLTSFGQERYVASPVLEKLEVALLAAVRAAGVDGEGEWTFGHKIQWNVVAEQMGRQVT